MTKPLITTIITTYHRPHYLKKAIQSVLSQTYPNFQICICDNASGDETAQIVADFTKKDPRIRYFCHEKNIGMLKNYAFGLSLVDTEFFSFLSDDDVLLPNFYSTALEEFQKQANAGFVAGSTAIMTEKGRVVRIPLSSWPREGEFDPPDGVFEMIGKYPIPTSVLFKRTVMGHICIDFENPRFWDCDYLLQIAAAFPIVISKKFCAIFRQHEDSFSNQNNLEEQISGYEKIINNLQKNTLLTKDQSQKATNLVIHDLVRCYKHFFLSSLMNKQFDNANRIANLIGEQPSFKEKSSLYVSIVKICKLFPFFCQGLYIMKHLKNLLRRLKHAGKKISFP